MEDTSILELYWQRDENAIVETEQKYGAYCRSIANNILHDTYDSEECVNDTWLQTWNSIPPSRPNVLRLFLARITRNLSINRYHEKHAGKRGGSQTDLVLEELAECLADYRDVEQIYEARALGEYIAQFVRSLPEREANLFVRRYFYAESVSVIGKHYEMTDNHVIVSLSRTRKKLKHHLEQEGYFHE